MMNTLLLVAAGGAVGSVLRYAVGLLVAFPMGTLAVNVLGSVAIGLLWGVQGDKGMSQMIAFLMFGVLGGFTTFSTFTLDTLRLVEAGRLPDAAGYVVASVVLALLACAAGLWIAREVLA